MDEDDEVQDVRYPGHTPYALNPNWLLKPKFSSPRGSMRSQMSSHVVNSIVTPNFFKYGVSSEEKFAETPLDDCLSILDSESGYGTWKCGSDISGDFRPLMVQMHRHKVAAITGQFVKIGARIVGENNLEDVDVMWYNRNRQITDGGRFRLRREGEDVWIEIFDCNAAEDAGEIVCVAVSDCDIVTDASLLAIHGKALQ